jgi:hypothetical protein
MESYADFIGMWIVLGLMFIGGYFTGKYVGYRELENDIMDFVEDVKERNDEEGKKDE